MRKFIAPLGIAGLAGAGLAAVLWLGPAGAQAPEDDQIESEGFTGPVAAALEDLVADGTLTQEQADAVLEAVGAEFDARRPFDDFLDTAAEVLGLTVEELQAATADGQSLADVAEAEGVERQVLVDALVADATAALDARDIPEERRAEIVEGLPEFIGRVVDGDLPHFGFGGPGPGHGFGGPFGGFDGNGPPDGFDGPPDGFDGFGPDEDETESEGD